MQSSPYLYILVRVFSRDILKGRNIGVQAGGRGVLGVYYLLENIIHYYYCQSEGGEDSSLGGEDPPPPPRKYPAVIVSSRFSKAIVQGVFFGVRKNMLSKVIHLKVNQKRN